MAFMRNKGLVTTHGLGSCVAICIYDEQIKLGGLIHLMLPDSKLNKAKAEKNPLLFVDTGVEAFLAEFTARGGNISRSVVKIAGGASSLMGEDLFHIGKRNAVNVRKLLWRHRLQIKSEDTGGTDSRTMILDVTDGVVLVKVPGQNIRSL
ncbi:MAG: chemotaxis protein CheD [Myxococcota bacterium]